LPAERVPARLTWTVDHLAPGPGERVLEIGGGRGVAAALVCSRLTTGRYVGIDRSPVALDAAVARNAEHVVRGTARFEQLALEDADPAVLGRFDAVFAVNVNLFWTRPARRELDVVRNLLADGGRLWLTYESPPPSGTQRLAVPLTERLDAAGFTSRTVVHEDPQGALLGLDCRP
jgi:SAM-dependent methyltransferase